MLFNQHIWRDWARNLHQWGLDNLTASLLESAGPLTILAAQMVYIGQPFLKLAVQENKIDALAQMLEDTQQKRSFISIIREAGSGESDSHS
jgi:hypothetical protein